MLKMLNWILDRLSNEEILIGGLTAIIVYGSCRYELNFFFTVLFFLLGLLHLFIINPFLKNKLEIRKLTNYHRGRERAFKEIIIILLFLPILYTPRLIHKYFRS